MAESGAEWRREKRLRELYVGRGMSLEEVGAELDCDGTTVLRWLKRHDIPRREKKRRSDGKELLHDADRLEEKYTNGASLTDIAAEVGCHRSTVQYWLKKHNINERNGPVEGSDHPRWKGGVSLHRTRYYGPNWTENREERILSDGEQCARCGIERGVHKERHNKDLPVHHIRPFDEFDSYREANELSNLITLCISCHTQLEGLPIDSD